MGISKGVGHGCKMFFNQKIGVEQGGVEEATKQATLFQVNLTAQDFKGSTAKNYCPVSLLSVVNKVIEKLVNKKIVSHLEKCGLFLFLIWFYVLINCRSSDSCI